MKTSINRDKNDIYGMPLLGFVFKNKVFLFFFKTLLAILFVYAIMFGLIMTGDENQFTPGFFWGLFWPFFMVVSLGFFGRLFCGICPHGFLGKYITMIGLNKTMPKGLKNPFISLLFLFFAWWLVYYSFPSLYKTPFATAMVFVVLTLLSVGFFFVFEKMAYCKSICPIGAVSRAFSKVSMTFLSTYDTACKECKTFECAHACSYNLKPFTFTKKQTMDDCTLCMDCASACEAVSFKLTAPSKTLFSQFKPQKFEVWAFILITAAISITMGFHHALGRSAISHEFIWSQTAFFVQSYLPLNSIDMVGVFAFVYAVAIVIFLTTGGMFIASKIMKISYKRTFYTLGYAFAPLFIIGGLSHIGEFFFYHYASNIVNGFMQAFFIDPAHYIEPLATRRDSWVHVFKAFNHIAYLWAFIILVKRMQFLETKRVLKVVAFPFAGALIVFYMSLTFYTGYVFKTYGTKAHNHKQLTQN
jgi:ferredoxin